MSDRETEAHKQTSPSLHSLDSKREPLTTYLITGASGSLGTALTLRLLAEGHKVRGFSRNEHRLDELEQKIPLDQRSRFSPIMGDVEQPEDLYTAFDGVDLVVHAAAAKVIPKGEYNARKFRRTNIDGTDNVAQACIRAKVRRAVFISTDKASAPATLYGYTKATAERSWLCSNRLTGGSQPYFMAVRYGNVWASQGSVIHAWASQIPLGVVDITDPTCTRFHIELDQAVDFVLDALHHAERGELWIPKLPSYRVGDLAQAFRVVYQQEKQPNIIGLRMAEKKHENMISSNESCSLKASVDGVGHRLGHYVLEPGVTHQNTGWAYTSGVQDLLSMADLLELVAKWAGRELKGGIEEAIKLAKFKKHGRETWAERNS